MKPQDIFGILLRLVGLYVSVEFAVEPIINAFGDLFDVNGGLCLHYQYHVFSVFIFNLIRNVPFLLFGIIIIVFAEKIVAISYPSCGHREKQ